MVTEKEEKKGKIVGAVTFYWIASLSVVFLNKLILSGSEKFPFPLSVTLFQLVVSLVLLVVCGKWTSHTNVPPFEFHKPLANKILPLSFCYVGMLATNNICLNYVEVTFYQVARSLTILFNIALTYWMLGQKTSVNAAMACIIVFIGFLVGSYGEMNFSFIGLIFGVSSSLFVALYGINVKKALILVDNNQWRLLHYNTAISCVLMIPLIFISGEWSGIYKQASTLQSIYFWLINIITGISGFLINIAVFLQIKYTTPLTNAISGTAKACVQTIIAWFIWQNVITSTNAFGIFLSLFGSGMYSYVRYIEMNNLK